MKTEAFAHILGGNNDFLILLKMTTLEQIFEIAAIVTYVCTMTNRLWSLILGGLNTIVLENLMLKQSGY